MEGDFGAMSTLASFFQSFFQNSMLKFFDDLFSCVLKETEGIEYVQRFSDLPMVFPLYQKHVGMAVVQILEVTGPRIEQLFEGVRDKIVNKKNLNTFISRLGAKYLNGPSENVLYFLAITSRIFSLMFKAEHHELSADDFIRECVKALEGTTSGPNALAGFKDLPILVVTILKSENWQEKFRDLNCGVASDYFPS